MFGLGGWNDVEECAVCLGGIQRVCGKISTKMSTKSVKGLRTTGNKETTVNIGVREERGKV